MAVTLSNKGHYVRICDINSEHLEEMRKNRENVRYLPGVKFGERLQVVDSTEEALSGADIALFFCAGSAFSQRI